VGMTIVEKKIIWIGLLPIFILLKISVHFRRFADISYTEKR